jgi:hypothetical protein
VDVTRKEKRIAGDDIQEALQDIRRTDKDKGDPDRCTHKCYKDASLEMVGTDTNDAKTDSPDKTGEYY